jgi:hypothetical protein
MVAMSGSLSDVVADKTAKSHPSRWLQRHYAKYLVMRGQPSEALT